MPSQERVVTVTKSNSSYEREANGAFVHCAAAAEPSMLRVLIERKMRTSSIGVFLGLWVANSKLGRFRAVFVGSDFLRYKNMNEIN